MVQLRIGRTARAQVDHLRRGALPVERGHRLQRSGELEVLSQECGGTPLSSHRETQRSQGPTPANLGEAHVKTWEQIELEARCRRRYCL